MKSGKYFEKDNISEENFDSGICISTVYLFKRMYDPHPSFILQI